MFDIGFWELSIIGVVALLVIGPEKLPGIARTAGVWFGKARRFVSSVQEDINREVNKSEELQSLIEEQSKIKDMHEIIENSVSDVKKTVSVGSQFTDHQPKAIPGNESNPLDSEKTPKQSSTSDKPSNENQASSEKQHSAEALNEQSK